MTANPLGRWFSTFQCPHCTKALRFDGRTNALGVAGSLCFVAACSGFSVASDPQATAVIAALFAAWVVLLGLSYTFRGVKAG